MESEKHTHTLLLWIDMKPAKTNIYSSCECKNHQIMLRIIMYKYTVSICYGHSSTCGFFVGLLDVWVWVVSFHTISLVLFNFIFDSLSFYDSTNIHHPSQVSFALSKIFHPKLIRRWIETTALLVDTSTRWRRKKYLMNISEAQQNKHFGLIHISIRWIRYYWVRFHFCEFHFQVAIKITYQIRMGIQYAQHVVHHRKIPKQ